MRLISSLILGLGLVLGGCGGGGDPIDIVYEQTLVDNIDGVMIRHGYIFEGSYVGAAADSWIVHMSLWTVKEKVNETDRIADFKTLHLFVDAGSTLKADGTPYQDGEVFLTWTASDTTWKTVEGFASNKRMTVKQLISTTNGAIELPLTDDLYDAEDPTLPPGSFIAEWEPEEGHFSDPTPAYMHENGPAIPFIFCPESEMTQASKDTVEAARNLSDGAPAEYKGWCTSPFDPI